MRLSFHGLTRAAASPRRDLHIGALRRSYQPIPDGTSCNIDAHDDNGMRARANTDPAGTVDAVKLPADECSFPRAVSFCDDSGDLI